MPDTHSWKSNLVDRSRASSKRPNRAQGIECGHGWSDLLEFLCKLFEVLNEPGQPKVKAVVVNELLGSFRVLAVHASAREHGAIDLAIKISRTIFEILGRPRPTCGSPVRNQAI